MRKALFEKLKESMISVLPVVGIVVIAYFTPFEEMTSQELMVFLICSVFLILGIGLFNLGADMSMTPMGDQVGAGLTKTRKIKLLVAVCFIMGLLITVAEPDLSVMAGQVAAVINPTVLIVFVGLGVGIFLVIAVVKIVFKVDLCKLLMLFYALMFSIIALLIESGH